MSMEKGQICYVIVSDDIEPAEFIEKYSSWQAHIKNLENKEELWVSLSRVCDTKEQAYTKLLNWLEGDRQRIEEGLEGGIEGLEEELDMINAAIKNLKQKYEI